MKQCFGYILPLLLMFLLTFHPTNGLKCGQGRLYPSNSIRVIHKEDVVVSFQEVQGKTCHIEIELRKNDCSRTILYLSKYPASKPTGCEKANPKNRINCYCNADNCNNQLSTIHSLVTAALTTYTDRVSQKIANCSLDILRSKLNYPTTTTTTTTPMITTTVPNSTLVNRTSKEEDFSYSSEAYSRMSARISELAKTQESVWIEYGEDEPEWDQFEAWLTVEVKDHKQKSKRSWGRTVFMLSLAFVNFSAAFFIWIQRRRNTMNFDVPNELVYKWEQPHNIDEIYKQIMEIYADQTGPEIYLDPRKLSKLYEEFVVPKNNKDYLVAFKDDFENNQNGFERGSYPRYKLKQGR